MVVSDLHLHTRRSNFASLAHAVQGSGMACDGLVLNGDIFDFRWNINHNVNTAIASAIADIYQFLQKWPECRVYYVVGNHDNHPEFVAALRHLATYQEQFSCHEYYLQLKMHLFLHGDCCDMEMDHYQLQTRRNKWAQMRRRPGYQGELYAVVEQLGVAKKILQLVLPKHQLAARTLHYLQTLPGGFPEGVVDIYLGHSHVPYRNYRYRGYQFHNSGSGILSQGYQPVRFVW